MFYFDKGILLYEIANLCNARQKYNNTDAPVFCCIAKTNCFFKKNYLENEHFKDFKV